MCFSHFSIIKHEWDAYSSGECHYWLTLPHFCLLGHLWSFCADRWEEQQGSYLYYLHRLWHLSHFFSSNSAHVHRFRVSSVWLLNSVFLTTHLCENIVNAYIWLSDNGYSNSDVFSKNVFISSAQYPGLCFTQYRLHSPLQALIM